FINDVELKPTGPTLGEAFAGAGYHTGFIGKWHLYGSPDGKYGRRLAYIPPEKRLGFQYWKACEFIEQRAKTPRDPYFLVLSLGPPHFPYATAPERYQAQYRERAIKLRPN